MLDDGRATKKSGGTPGSGGTRPCGGGVRPLADGPGGGRQRYSPLRQSGVLSPAGYVRRTTRGEIILRSGAGWRRMREAARSRVPEREARKLPARRRFCGLVVYDVARAVGRTVRRGDDPG